MFKNRYVIQETDISINRIFKEHTCNSQVMEDRVCRNSILFENVTIHFTTCKSDWFCLTELIVFMFFSLGYRQLLDFCILLETLFQ